MFTSLEKAYAQKSSSRTPEPPVVKPPTKQAIVLSPRVQRIVVVTPTVVLSMWLSALGFPLFPRVALCVGVGAVLILLVARHQRRRLS